MHATATRSQGPAIAVSAAVIAAVPLRFRRLWKAADFIGVGLIVCLFGACFYSLYLDISYWGIDGLVLGRMLNRNDGGGVHTLSVLAIIIPIAAWGWKLGLNRGLIFASMFLADYYHEGFWNAPYYEWYKMGTNLPEYLIIAGCIFLWFSMGVYKGQKTHNFRHVLYLTPWMAMVTLYVIYVRQYSEDLFGPQSFYTSVPVNSYEIFEVALFGALLYYGLTRMKDGIPVVWTVYGVSAGVSSRSAIRRVLLSLCPRSLRRNAPRGLVSQSPS